MPPFSKKEALSRGWELFKANWLFLVGVTIVSLVVGYLPTAISGYFNQQQLVSMIFWIIFWVAGLIISVGLTKIYLNLTDGQPAAFSDLFVHWQLTPKYLLIQILVGLIVMVGFILFIIPGVIFGIRLQFASYLLIDRNLGPVEAVKKSWAMTGGSVWNLFLFGLLIGLLYILGVLVVGVGMLVAMPLAGLATTIVYRQLSVR